MKELWPGVLDSLRDSGQELLSTVLEAARPVAVDAQEAVLEVGFPESAAFNKRKAEATEARELLAQAVERIVGQRLRPVFVLLDGDAGGDEGAEERLSPDELIERFKSEFDAEEVEAEADGAEANTDAREATG